MEPIPSSCPDCGAEIELTEQSIECSNPDCDWWML